MPFPEQRAALRRHPERSRRTPNPLAAPPCPRFLPQLSTSRTDDRSAKSGHLTAYGKKKLSLSAFADAGEVRDSKSGTVTSSPAFATGGVVTYKLNKTFGLLFVPGEYVRTFPASGGDLNNFTSRFGFTIAVPR